jgi:hypothetical protein
MVQQQHHLIPKLKKHLIQHAFNAGTSLVFTTAFLGGMYFSMGIFLERQRAEQSVEAVADRVFDSLRAVPGQTDATAAALIGTLLPARPDLSEADAVSKRRTDEAHRSAVILICSICASVTLVMLALAIAYRHHIHFLDIARNNAIMVAAMVATYFTFVYSVAKVSLMVNAAKEGDALLLRLLGKKESSTN